MPIKKRPLAKLVCEKCGSINYYTFKSREAKEIKLSFKKYCKRCRKHTLHKEGKK